MVALSVVVMCFGVIVPMLPEVQIEYFRRATDCLRSGETACASQASTAFGITQSLSSLGVLLLSPYYGKHSDSHGRRPFLCAGLFAQALPFLALCTWNKDVRLFYVFQALAGFAPAPNAVLFTVVADRASPTKRLQSFGCGAACISAAFSLGAGFSALLQPLLGAGGLLRASTFTAVAALVVAMVLLPETLPAGNQHQRPRVVRSKSLARILVVPDSSRNEGLLRSIAAVGLLSLLPEAGTTTIALFYAKARLHLSEQEVSSLGAHMFCIVGAGGFLWQTVGIAGLRRLCPSTLWVYQVALVANLLHMLGYVVLWAPWVLLLNAAFAGGPLAQPTILRGLVSEALPADVQGYGSGVLSSVEAACRVVAPTLFSGLFFAGGEVGMPWLPFGAGTCFVIAGSLLAASSFERLGVAEAKAGSESLLAA
uniref:Major facilitator superfamily (MFS) profile domain-containing protein n=1 Tax=Alexandrium monilatum TaxID=311494 RepID=A0A7S4SGT3_9DINO